MPVALVQIEKPSSALQPILLGGGSGGVSTYIGAVASNKFTIKLINYDIRSRVPMEEISGDGDEGPVFDYVPWTYVSMVIDGIMLVSEAVGIRELRDQDLLDQTIIVKLGAAQTFTMPSAVIHSINISATRRGLFNRVQMSMESTAQVSGTVWETA